MIPLLFALACHPAGEPTATPVAAPEVPPLAAPEVTFAPTAVQSEMIRRLSMRDGAPPCAEVEAGSTDVVADLQAIVRNVASPPAVPMRAAECLIAEGDAGEAEFTRWMTGPDTKGLAMLLADRVDSLPVPLAERVVASGLAGPHADVVRTRVLTSARPELRGLAGGAP